MDQAEHDYSRGESGLLGAYDGSVSGKPLSQATTSPRVVEVAHTRDHRNESPISMCGHRSNAQRNRRVATAAALSTSGSLDHSGS